MTARPLTVPKLDRSARPQRRVAAIALAAAAGLTALAAAQNAPAPVEATTAPAAERVTPSGLKIIELGRGDLAVQPGDTVTCHYTGKLDNGTVFDSSLTRNQPFVFRLGVDGVIKGWAEGIVGMKIGDRRRLIIPPELGYGARGVPPKIPANATLTFELEIISIERPKPLSDAPPPVTINRGARAGRYASAVTPRRPGTARAAPRGC